MNIKNKNNKQGVVVIKRTGSYRLSRVLRQSTIGDERFNVRVRNGIGWDTLAITTGSSDYYIKELSYDEQNTNIVRNKPIRQLVSVS